MITLKNFEQNKHLCGGKALNLFLLQKAGFSVPPLMVIDSHEVSKIIAPVLRNVQNICSDENNVLTQLQKINAEIKSLKIENTILTEINSLLTQELNETMFSVRSSINVEDGTEDSFAGIFKSYINISKDSLPDKILDCIASVYHSNVYEYCKNKRIDFASLRPSIIIQEMIIAKKSGILFTMNPLGNYNESIISAAFGYCDAIVTNEAQTENYYIDRQSSSIYIDSIHQVLNNQEIINVYEQGIAIEKLFNHPQDIEFSFDAKNALYILQARPVTTINLSAIKILDNSNIVESYPGITLPLSFTFAKKGYENVFGAAAKYFGLSDEKIQAVHPQLSDMISHINGRVYYNLHNWYILMKHIVSDESSLKAWETLIGIQRSNERHASSFAKKTKNGLAALKLYFNYNSIVDKFYKNFEENYYNLRSFIASKEFAEADNCTLFKKYKTFENKMFTDWAPTLVNDFFTFKFFDLLKKECLKLGLHQESIANDLLIGMDGVDSEKVILDLLSIKEKVNDNADYKALFKKDIPTIQAEIMLSKYAGLKKQIDVYINDYGDRTLNELKLESLNYRIHPAGFYELLRSQLQNEHASTSYKAHQQSLSESALQQIKASEKYRRFNKVKFDYILKMTKTTVRNRENMRIRRAKAYGAVKDIFYKIGENLTAQNKTDKPEHIFLLTIQEVENIVCNKFSGDLLALIKERQQQFKELENISMPDRIIYEKDVPSFHSGNLSHISDKELNGLPISAGIVSGEALVLHKADFNADADKKILVTQYTDPAWVFLMSRASGIITEKGSPLSHTAIVGRELGIPVIINVQSATKLISSGQLLNMNGSTGEISIQS